jgi:hypothetical protein
LSAEQQAEVARLVREGPTYSQHGVVRWRRVDLSRVIETRFGVQLAERSVGALLHRLGFRRWRDEARVGQQGTLTLLRAERGSRPCAPRDCRYDWAYIFGAVCPARGTGAALVLPYANAEAMTLHLAEISRHVAHGAHAIITMDGAGWHKEGGRLKVPDNISLLPLPPYSPELNPQENVWQYLRQNHLANRKRPARPARGGFVRPSCFDYLSLP